MELLKISKENTQFNIFLEKANEAYSARSDEKVPFSPISAEDITAEEQIFILIDGGEVVSGCCLYPMSEKAVRLQHVWTDVCKPRKGYAGFMVNEVTKIAKEQGYLQIKLGVMSAYKPAYNLYKNRGWKGYAIVANQPKTCYTVSMVKYLGEKGKTAFGIKRAWKFFLSKIKFFLLFKKDSTPKCLYRVIYKK